MEDKEERDEKHPVHEGKKGFPFPPVVIIGVDQINGVFREKGDCGDDQDGELCYLSDLVKIGRKI